MYLIVGGILLILASLVFKKLSEKRARSLAQLGTIWWGTSLGIILGGVLFMTGLYLVTH